MLPGIDRGGTCGVRHAASLVLLKAVMSSDASLTARCRGLWSIR